MFSNPSESIPCFFIFWLVFENNSDCSASRGTRRATAVYVIQFTREPARPASREARCRAAVTRSQPAFPQAAPRSMGAVWGAGALPLLVARRRPLSANWRFIHQPREPRGPLPSGGNSQPTRFPTSSPAPYGRGMGCRGTTPAREPRGPSPSGGNSAANRLSPYAPARLARSPGCRGTAPA